MNVAVAIVWLLSGPLRALWRSVAEYYRWQGRIEGAAFGALVVIGLFLIFLPRRD